MSRSPKPIPAAPMNGNLPQIKINPPFKAPVLKEKVLNDFLAQVPADTRILPSNFGKPLPGGGLGWYDNNDPLQDGTRGH